MQILNIINEIRHHPWLTTVLVALIIGSNAWTMVSFVNVHDPHPDYWQIYIQSSYCDPLEYPKHISSEKPIRNPLKWWVHCVSYQYTGSVKTIPMIFNIGVMPLVYLLGYRLTNDRLIGLISLVAFINNPLYRDWYTSATYDQIWSFFVLLSVLLMYRTRFSILPFGIGILAKGVTYLYFPAWLYTLYQIRRKKLEIIIILSIIGMIAIASHYTINIVGNDIGFFPERWEDAVYRNISVLWQVIPILALFIVLNRNFIPKNKVINQNIAWVWMLVSILQNPLVYFFTLQDTYSYRYVPLAAFLSIFIGMTLVNIGNWYQERQLARTK